MNDTTYSNYIEVFPLPSAIFDLTPSVTNLLTANIEFTDQSIGDIANWTWSFGDGSNSGLQNPQHLYNDTGTYIITLNIITVDGCMDMTQRELLNRTRLHILYSECFSLRTMTGTMKVSDHTVKVWTGVRWSFPFSPGGAK